MGNDFIIRTKIDTSGIGQGSKEVEALVSKSLAEIDKKITAYKERLLSGSSDSTFIEKEAEGIKKAISGLEKQANALRKLQGLEDLKKELTDVVSKLDDLGRRGVNGESIAKAYDLNGKLKELSEARDAIVRDINEESSVVKELSAERDALSKRVLSDTDLSELNSELQALESGSTDEMKELVALYERLINLNEEFITGWQEDIFNGVEGLSEDVRQGCEDLNRASELLGTSDFVDEFSDDVIDLKEVFSGLLPDNFESLKAEAQALKDTISQGEADKGYFSELNDAIDASMAKLEELKQQRLKYDTEISVVKRDRNKLGFSDEDASNFGDLSVLKGAYKEQIQEWEQAYKVLKSLAESSSSDIAAQVEADANNAVKNLVSSFETGIDTLEESLSHPMTLGVDVDQVKEQFDEVVKIYDELNEKSDEVDFDWFEAMGERLYNLRGTVEKVLANIPIGGAYENYSKAEGEIREKELQGLKKEVADLDKQIDDLYQRGKEAVDGLPEGDKAKVLAPFENQMTGLLGKRAALLEKISAIEGEEAAQQEEVAKRTVEAAIKTAEALKEEKAEIAKEEDASLIDVSSLQKEIEKRREAAEAQREYVERLREQRDLMEDKAIEQGDFSGDSYRLLDLQLEQATEKMYDLESEGENLINWAADFRRGLQELGGQGSDGLREVEEALGNLLEQYGDYGSMVPEGGYDGGFSFAVDDLEENFQKLKEAGVSINDNAFDRLISSDAVKGAEEYANAVDDLSDKVSEVRGEFADFDNEAKAPWERDPDAKWGAFAEWVNSVKTSLAPLKKVFDLAGDAAGVFSKVTTKALNVTKASLKSLADTAGKIGSKIGSSIKPIASGFVGVSKSLLGFNMLKSVGDTIGGLFNRIAKLASLAFVFRVITQGFRQLKNDVVDAFGTYLNYDSSLNSSINTLKTQFSALKAQLASAFAPVIAIVVPILSQLVGWCVTAANAVSAFIASLTGQTSWKKAVVSSVGAVGDSASNAADNLGEAADKADELKEKLGSYDELNVISDDSKSKSSGKGAGGGGGSGAGSGAGISYEDVKIGEKIADLADRLKEMWKNADFTELGSMIGNYLKKGMESIPWKKIQETANKVGKSTATLLNGVFETPDLGFTFGKTIGEAINTQIALAKGFIDNFHFDSLGNFIKEGVNGIIYTVNWSDAASVIRDGLNGIFTAIKTATDPIFGINFGELGRNIGGFITDCINLDWETAKQGFENLGKGIGDFINGLADAEVISGIGTALAGAVDTIVAGFNGLASNIDAQKIGTDIATGLNNFFSTADWESLGFSFGTAADKIAQTIVTTLKELEWSGVFEFSTSIGSSIAEAFNKVITVENLSEVGSFFANSINTLVTGAHEFFTTADWSGWGTALGSSLNSFFADVNWSEVGLTLNDAVLGIIDLLSSAVKETDWVLVGESIGEMIKNINWNEVLSGVFDLAVEVAKGLLTALFAADKIVREGSYDKEVQDMLTNARDLQTEADKLISKKSDIEGAAEAEMASNTRLAASYFELKEKEHLTAEEKATLKQKGDELVEAFPELQSMYDEETGMLNTTRESVDKLIEAYGRQAKIEGYKQYLTELYKEQAALEGSNEELFLKVLDLNKACADYGVTLDDLKKEAKGNWKGSLDYADALSKISKEAGLTSEEAASLAKEWSDNRDALKKLEDRIGETTSKLVGLEEEGDVDIEITSTDNATEGAEKAKESAEGVTKDGVSIEVKSEDKAEEGAKEAKKSAEKATEGGVSMPVKAKDEATEGAEKVKESAEETTQGGITIPVKASDETAEGVGAAAKSLGSVPKSVSSEITATAYTSKADESLDATKEKAEKIDGKTVIIEERVNSSGVEETFVSLEELVGVWDEAPVTIDVMGNSDDLRTVLDNTDVSLDFFKRTNGFVYVEFDGKTYAFDARTQEVQSVISEYDGKQVTTEFVGENHVGEAASEVNADIATVSDEKVTTFKGDDQVSSDAGAIDSKLGEMPSEKTISFLDVGGLALSMLAAGIVGLVVNSIPDEKTITFTVDNQTEEPIKTIKEAISGIQAHVKDPVLTGIKADVSAVLEFIKTGVNSELLGADSVKTRVERLKADAKALGEEIRSTAISQIKNIKDEATSALGPNGIQGRIAALKSNADSMMREMVRVFASAFSEMRRSASLEINAIQRFINDLQGKSLTVEVYYEDVDGVEEWLNNLQAPDLYGTITYTAVYDTPTYVAKGGIFNNGSWSALANGGIFNNGFWQNVPHYASGTSRAHGTAFVAGEAGPEIVGHIGGRTEVLNKSQIASAIYSSVYAALVEGLPSAVNSLINNIIVAANSINSSIWELGEVIRSTFDSLKTTPERIERAMYDGSAASSGRIGELSNTLTIGNKETFYRIADLIKVHEETNQLIKSGFNVINMLSVTSKELGYRGAEVSNILAELSDGLSKGQMVDMVINLDGRVIYEDMLQLDRNTQRITGRSGFFG